MQALAPWREAAYGAPYLVKALALTPLLVFIPSFYAVDYGVPLELVGGILFATRMFDIVTDPLIGVVSDKARWRFGRRKPFIVIGAPLLMISAWMVFAPPVDVTPVYAAIWLTAIFLGYTIMDIPYRAWGAELLSSYDGRTRLFAWRDAAEKGSSALALGLILAAPVLGLASTADTLQLLAIIYVVALPILVAFTVWAVPEREAVTLEHVETNWRESMLAMLSNKPFRALLLGLTVFISGGIIGASLHLIVMESYFGIRHLFPIILAAETIAGLISVPFWVWVAKKIGKHKMTAVAALLMAILSAPIPLLAPEQWQLYAGCIIVRGAAGGAIGLMIFSMLADVTDVDLNKTGEARAGLFYAIMGMVGKFGIALGALVGLALPPVFGFDAANPENSDLALDALLMTYAWIPMLIMGSSAPFFWRYTLSREAHEAIQAEIAERARS